MSGISKYFAETNAPSVFFDTIPAESDIKVDVVSSEMEAIAVQDTIRDIWIREDSGSVTMLTSPGILSANDLTDPILDKTIELLGKEAGKERNTMLPDDVTQDERGLRKLIEEGCFRSAVTLSSRLLAIYGQGVGRLGQPAKHTFRRFVACSLFK